MIQKIKYFIDYTYSMKIDIFVKYFPAKMTLMYSYYLLAKQIKNCYNIKNNF